MLTLGTLAVFAACGQTEVDAPKTDASAGGSGGATGGSAGGSATGGSTGGAAPIETETCADGTDNDKNGQTDCADPDCFGECNCELNEDCSNGIDDDCDGLADCKDPGCNANHCCSGAGPKAESCANGIDDDCDGKTDCADSDCASDACCGDAGTLPESCGNGVDDDCDGKADCSDPDCAPSACACTQPSDCAIPDNLCLMRTCESGACGTKPLGPLVYIKPDPSPGNCRSFACGGDGGSTEQFSDSDAPPQVEPCFQVSCFDGALQGWAADDGTPCGSGLSCKRDCPSSACKSRCVGCQDASTCPAGDECKAAKCWAGVCGFAFVPTGHLTSGNKAHDCVAHVCDGQGTAVTKIDDADLPDDGNPCTFDLCASGASSFTNAPAGTPCGGGQTCNGSGKCGP
ncbi:MAG: hypothetical protein HYZ29_30765 [Myxococcales bacterium]|nr:hypothetical protein [Myxococcales bacterium]